MQQHMSILMRNLILGLGKNHKKPQMSVAETFILVSSLLFYNLLNSSFSYFFFVIFHTTIKERSISLAVYKEGHQTLAVHELPKAFGNVFSLPWLSRWLVGAPGIWVQEFMGASTAVWLQSHGLGRLICPYINSVPHRERCPSLPSAK